MVTIPMEEGLSILSTSLLPPSESQTPRNQRWRSPPRVTPAGLRVSSPLPRQCPCRELARWSGGAGFLLATHAGPAAHPDSPAAPSQNGWLSGSKATVTNAPRRSQVDKRGPRRLRFPGARRRRPPSTRGAGGSGTRVNYCTFPL